MEKKLTVDRIEEGKAVLFDDDGNKYEAEHSFLEGAVLLCEIFEDGSIEIIKECTEEAEDRMEKNRSRLFDLFTRGDNKK